MDELLLNFKKHLELLNRSPATVKAYMENLEKFFDVIEEVDVKKVNQGMIENYATGLHDYRTKDDKPYSNNTICMKIRSVKRFFEYLEESNNIFIDPTENIKEPKVQRNILKPILTPQEVDKLLEQPDLSTYLGVRDRTILEVFYSTGIRKEELCILSIYDADLKEGVLRVKGKGNKERFVPVGKQALKFLQKYLTTVRPHYAKDNLPTKNLFLDIHGKPIRKQTVRVLVKKYGKASKLNKSVSPHMFRHCFATSLIKNGADIIAVQKMLGHACASTTQTYIRSLGFEVKRVHKKTHPREKDKVSLNSIKPKIKRIIPKDETD